MQRPLKSKSSTIVPAWPQRRFVLGAVAFHVLIFVYVWLRIEPALGQQRSGPLFFLTRSFLGEYLEHPGGLLDYAAAGLAQLDYSSLLGALGFTALAGLVFLTAWRASRRITGLVLPVVPFVAPFLLLLARQREDCPALAIGLGVLAGLGMALAYFNLPWRKPWQRVAACGCVAATLGVVAGLWPCLLFLSLAGLFEIVRQRRYAVALAGLLLGLALSGVVMGLSDLDPSKALNPWGRGMGLLLASAVYLSVPLAALVLGLVPQLAGIKTDTAPEQRGGSSGARPRRGLRLLGVRRVAAAGLLVAGGALVWLSFDSRSAALARIEFAASRTDYPKVLKVAARLQPMTPAAEVRLHLALYHTGQLLTGLFAFTNQVAWELLPGFGAGVEASRAQADTLLELGQVSEAEHLAHEALEFEGDRPDLLRLLARVNVLKERPNAARVFLNRLRQSPVHRRWATTRLQELEADPLLPDDREVSLIRSRLVTTDLPHDGMPTETFLKQLLHSNARNQMAFEYLLAHYLLTLDLDRFAGSFAQFHDFSYAAIPRHCEEAILLHERLRGVKVDSRGREIRPETRQRFRQFCDALDHGAQRSVEGRQALARDFGDTFWYYYSTRPAAGPSATR